MLGWEWNTKSQFFKTELAGHLASWLDWAASSIWTFCPVVLQLAWRFCFSACFTRVHHLAACQSRVPASVHILKHFFTLSHTLPLHDSHLNARFLSAELQANWHGIKPTKWLIKFNLTIATEEITKLLTSILILITLSMYENKHF